MPQLSQGLNFNSRDMKWLRLILSDHISQCIIHCGACALFVPMESIQCNLRQATVHRRLIPFDLRQSSMASSSTQKRPEKLAYDAASKRQTAKLEKWLVFITCTRTQANYCFECDNMCRGDFLFLSLHCYSFATHTHQPDYHANCWRWRSFQSISRKYSETGILRLGPMLNIEYNILDSASAVQSPCIVLNTFEFKVHKLALIGARICGFSFSFLAVHVNIFPHFYRISKRFTIGPNHSLAFLFRLP